MRTWYFLTCLAVIGFAGLAGWATLGSAQTVIQPGAGKQPPAVPIIESVRSPDESSSIKIPDVNGNQPSAAIPIKPAPMPPAPIEPGKLVPPLKDMDKPEDQPLAAPSGQPLTPHISQLEKPLVSDIASSSRQEPAVSLEWIGPSAVKVGMPAEYSLSVRNICTIPVQKVIVQVRVPTGVNVVTTEPKAEGSENVLVWELGTLLARQDRRLNIKLMSTQRGDIPCQAWVTFTGSALMKMRVREPKLVVKVTVPEKALVGDPANLVLTVANPGDHPADKVKITATLAEGLETIRGNKLNYDLGTLSAGETRTVTVPCVPKSPGRHKCDVFAEAEGGLKAGENVAVNVIQPRLDLAVVGPKMRYLDKKATYTFKVANPGDAPAANVFITDIVPHGFKFVSADNGGQFDEASRSVKWFLGELGAGQHKEVKVELLAAAQGEFTHKIMAHASRGMKADQEIKTMIEGLSAIQMELVDTEDPVEVGSDTAYEIKVTNTGSKAETDVRLVCTVPTLLKLKNVQGPVQYNVVGNEIIFQPLPRLAPKADVVYRVTVTAAQKGDARFKASLTTSGLVEPVVKVEPTKVYAE